MKPGPDGRLYAINPEAGFFGVAPGTNMVTNPNAMYSVAANTIFTNTALTADGDVWWEGMGEPARRSHRLEGPTLVEGARHARRPPELALHDPGRSGPRHRARVAGPGRRADRRDPLRRSARQRHSRSSSSRAAGTTACSWARSWPQRRRRRRPATVGNLRRDPFAMLPFCGYNMADYFGHWLTLLGALRRGEAAQDLLRQLVPQGRRRPLALAGLRRELPRARVGLRAHGRARRRRRDADRLRADAEAINVEGLDVTERRPRPSCCASTTTSGAPKCRGSASTTPSSTNASHSSSPKWSSDLEARLR